jgi:hypothetical protein
MPLLGVEKQEPYMLLAKKKFMAWQANTSRENVRKPRGRLGNIHLIGYVENHCQVRPRANAQPCYWASKSRSLPQSQNVENHNRLGDIHCIILMEAARFKYTRFLAARKLTPSTDFYFGREGTDQSREGDCILPIFSINVI